MHTKYARGKQWTGPKTSGMCTLQVLSPKVKKMRNVMYHGQQTQQTVFTRTSVATQRHPSKVQLNCLAKVPDQLIGHKLHSKLVFPETCKWFH